MSDGLILHPSAAAIRPFADADGKSANAHPGLLFDRYLPLWKKGPVGYQRVDLYHPLRRFADHVNRSVSAKDGMLAELLKQLHSRQSRLEKVQAESFRVDWRFVTGVGADHPTENGFLFDPIIGSPYIPGSAVKGFCRAAATVLMEMTPSQMKIIFGSENNTLGVVEEDFQCGSATFFDAYPTTYPEKLLEVDVINCHHPKYYRSLDSADTSGVRGGRPDARPAGPSETESPIPVFFLVVGRDTEFTFRFRAADPELIRSLLKLGLEWLGLGAKTSAGYGFMSAPQATANVSASDDSGLRGRVESFNVNRMGELAALMQQIAETDDPMRGELTKALFRIVRKNRKARQRMRQHPVLGGYVES